MNTRAPLPYTADVEVVPPDEPDDVQQILDIMRELFVRDEAASGQRRRDVHVKSHGCPVARFEILAELPAELQQGLFQHARTYPAAVRLSNSSPRPLPDAVPDGRGVAIKLSEVTGPGPLVEGNPEPGVQDFILVNGPAFVVADVRGLLRVEQARLAGVRHPQSAAAALAGGNWNPFHWNWGSAVAIASLLAHFPAHPAHLTYYSITPFRFGEYVAKFRLKPASATSPLEGISSLLRHRDAFRLVLEQMLRAAELIFDFQVQLRTCAESMPIEDATVVWPESRSPYRTVARLVIPQQDLNASPYERGDSLSFSVWNALEAHRPLGGLNRSRRAAYQLSAAWRRSGSAE